MKRSIVIAAITAIGVTVWLGSNSFNPDSEPEAQKEPALLAGEKTLVKVRTAFSQAEERRAVLLVNGQAEADRTILVKSETSGPIETLLADKGDRISRDQILATIAEQDRPAKLAEAKALVAQRWVELDAARKLKAQGHRAETQVAGNEAAYESARAYLRQSEVALDRLTIKAPFEGIVEDRLVERGDFVDIGDPLYQLVDLDPLKIVAYVSEQDVGQIDLGQAASGRLVTGQMVEGVVTFISPAAERSTRTFRVEVDVPNPEFTLLDGITAELQMPLKSVKAHKISPAILSLNSVGQVGVRAAVEGRAKFYPIQILDQDSGAAWVTGLPDRLDLIIVGQDFVTDGQQIEAVDEAQVKQQALRPSTAQQDE